MSALMSDLVAKTAIDRRLAEIETFYVSSNPRLSAEIERLR